jgi:hypothetical protein
MSLGAVSGPRNSGYSRSTTVTNGQSEPQLNSHIGRDEAAGPDMACKGSAVISMVERRVPTGVSRRTMSRTAIGAAYPCPQRRSTAPTGPLTNLVERRRLARCANRRASCRKGGSPCVL